MKEWDYGCTTDTITINAPGWYTIGWCITLHLDNFTNLPSCEISDVMVNGKVSSTKMISASEFFEDEYGTHARYIYESSAYVDSDDKVQGQLRFKFDGEFTHTNEIRATENKVEVNLIEADPDDTIMLYDTNEPVKTYLTLEELPLGHMVSFHGKDNEETLAVNCHTGEVTINADNPNITEAAKEFWRAVATTFPGLFKEGVAEQIASIEPELENNSHAAFDRAMGVLNDNG